MLYTVQFWQSCGDLIVIDLWSEFVAISEDPVEYEAIHFEIQLAYGHTLTGFDDIVSKE